MRDCPSDWSSTCREVRGMRRCLQELQRSAPQLMRSAVVQITNDNQGAVSDCARMRGGPRVWPDVLELLVWALEHSLTLLFQWRWREDPLMQLADANSKVADVSDWLLSRKCVADQILRAPLFGAFDGDLFASRGAHQPVPYVAAQWDGLCCAADAWAQDWGQWLPGQPAVSGRQPRYFLFPPLKQLARVLAKIRHDQADVFLVCARYLDASLDSVLQALPVPEDGRVNLEGPRDVLVRPTRRVPAEARAGGWKTLLQVVRIDGSRL